MKRLRRVPGLISPEPAVAGTYRDAELTRQQTWETAREMLLWASSGYGPTGGHKLVVDGEDSYVLPSPARALREIRVGDWLVQPYKDLATRVQADVGDGATTSLLLAAGIVNQILRKHEEGVPIGVLLDGLDLARRQAIAWLSANAAPTAPEQLLYCPYANVLIAGLQQFGDDGELDLDQVQLLLEGTEAQWADGLVIAPAVEIETRKIANGAVLLVADEDPRKPGAATYRIRQLDQLTAASEQERRDERSKVGSIRDAGIRLICNQKTFNEEFARKLANAGLLVCENVPKDEMARLSLATGAEVVARPSQSSAATLGVADLSRRPRREGGWLVRGPGAAATLLLPKNNATKDKLTLDNGERALRMAGAIIADPRGLAGGGQWQRGVADSLRAASRMASGKAAFGLEAVAEAFDQVADASVAGAGKSPLDHSTIGEKLDAYACMAPAVSAALDCAAGLLRLDGLYQKRGSTGDSLRGGGDKIGSPRGMPGDIPSLM